MTEKVVSAMASTTSYLPTRRWPTIPNASLRGAPIASAPGATRVLSRGPAVLRASATVTFARAVAHCHVGHGHSLGHLQTPVIASRVRPRFPSGRAPCFPKGRKAAHRARRLGAGPYAAMLRAL